MASRENPPDLEAAGSGTAVTTSATRALAESTMDGRTRSIIAGFVLLGFVLRLAFGLGYWVGKPLTLDEQEYFLLATQVATSHEFGYPPTPALSPPVRHFERPPAFAFFLAAVLAGTNDRLVAESQDNDRVLFPRSSSDVPRSIKIAQSMVGALGILLIAALAGRAAGPRAAIAGAAIAAFYPPLIWMCAYVLSEPLYSALALATVWLLQKAGDSTGRRQLGLGLGAGMLAGAALLTKEAMIFFLPLAAAWLVLRRRRGLALVLAAGVAVVAVPWIVRNYLVHDRFVLTAAHGGVTLWTGNNPLSPGEGDLAANPEMARARVAFEDSHPGLSNLDLDELYYREVLRFVSEHPLRLLALDVTKLFYTFVPIGPSYQLHSRRYYAASLVSYGLLAPVAVVGLWRLFKRGLQSRLWAVGLLFASTVVMSLVFFPQERFRIPVIDPSAIVAAAVCWGGKRSR